MLRDVIIVGGGYAGLSAAIYLARDLWDTLILNHGQSMGVWEPEVQNYLGFPEPLSGSELLRRGREQALEYGAAWINDEVLEARRSPAGFELVGTHGCYQTKGLLLATGITHLPPDVPGIRDCLGKSIFYCKDCDGYRVRGQKVAIIGHNDEAARYAFAMLRFSCRVMILTNGAPPCWSDEWDQHIRSFDLLVQTQPVSAIHHQGGFVEAFEFEGGRRYGLDAAFAVRGDVYHHRLALMLGARVDREGQVLVDDDLQTSVPGLYAAGCVTPANCQMIVAAGQGAAAAQAINRGLFETALEDGSLRKLRLKQCQAGPPHPPLLA